MEYKLYRVTVGYTIQIFTVRYTLFIVHVWFRATKGYKPFRVTVGYTIQIFIVGYTQYRVSVGYTL